MQRGEILPEVALAEIFICRGGAVFGDVNRQMKLAVVVPVKRRAERPVCAMPPSCSWYSECAIVVFHLSA